MAFNVVLALVFIGLLDPLARLLEKLFPARKDAADPASPRYLDESRARDALARAGGCRPRDAAHGRRGRGHAAAGHAGADDQRPGARARGLAHGQRGRQARRGHQALRHQADARQSRRARGPPGHGDHLLHHQPGARRRHHRQEPGRAGGQEDQAQAAVLQRRRRGAGGLPQAHPGEPAHRARRVHVRRRQGGAQADRRQDAAAQCRARRGRAPPGAPARRPAGDAGDDVAAPRCAARPEAHPLAHLLGGLSGARGRRRDRPPTHESDPVTVALVSLKPTGQPDVDPGAGRATLLCKLLRTDTRARCRGWQLHLRGV